MGKPTSHSVAERMSLRVGRFIRTAHPNLTDMDRALAEEWLPDELLVLFMSQSEADQRHAVLVARLLLRSGYSSRDLIAAALLHDAGKRNARFTPWHRTAIVLLEATVPALLRWMGRWGRHPLLAPFAVHQAHATLGASLALRSGASDRTVRLIREHHRRSLGDEDLQMLRWADDHA